MIDGTNAGGVIMKKAVFLGVALFLLVGLTACGNSSTSGDDAGKKPSLGTGLILIRV